MTVPEERRCYIEQEQGPWQDCPAGITASEKAVPPRTRVQEVAGEEAGVRVFVVDSEQRREYEQGQWEMVWPIMAKTYWACGNCTA